MRRYLQYLDERDILFLLLLSVQTVDNREGSHFEMKENSIRESVMLLEKILYLSTLQTNHTRYIIKTTGGVINGTP